MPGGIKSIDTMIKEAEQMQTTDFVNFKGAIPAVMAEKLLDICEANKLTRDQLMEGIGEDLVERYWSKAVAILKEMDKAGTRKKRGRRA